MKTLLQKTCLLALLTGSIQSAAQSQCTLGGSTKYCGYAQDGSISGGFATPCACQRPSFFEYIGGGDTCNNAPVVSSIKPCPVTDTTSQVQTVDAVPTPASAPFYFIVFVLSDQVQASPGTPTGESTGNFAPIGVYDASPPGSPSAWDSSQIRTLSSRSPNTKVMASLGGDQSATIWTGVADVGTYVADATASLSQYYSSTEYQLAGFDIDYEAGITTVVNNQAVTDPQWLSCFCEIITNLKQAFPEILITFAPFGEFPGTGPYPQGPYGTTQAYKDLQNCLAQANVNIDYIIYQTYSIHANEPYSASVLADQTTALTSAQALFAPIKVIAGLSNGMAATYSTGGANVVTQLYQPLFSSNTVIGAAVFDADVSQVANYYSSSAFNLEQALWG